MTRGELQQHLEKCLNEGSKVEQKKEKEKEQEITYITISDDITFIGFSRVIEFM